MRALDFHFLLKVAPSALDFQELDLIRRRSEPSPAEPPTAARACVMSTPVAHRSENWQETAHSGSSPATTDAGRAFYGTVCCAATLIVDADEG
ncbi:MAG: hypothetical protein M3322_10040 [Actinomycetota bacterium]|nr:hypothetical protein [Actinomycetota bacterium]